MRHVCIYGNFNNEKKVIGSIFAAGFIHFNYPIICFTKFNDMKKNKNFEVIIVGGSYAGLSAAMALGRSLRHVLVIDSGKPCNRQTPHSHNFLTQDGKTPVEISTLAKNQVEQYKTIHFQDDLATSGKKTNEGFEIQTKSGKTFIGKKLIFSTGIKDMMPTIKGFSESWGISIIHCPYCHGYEFRNQKTAIMANADKAFHLAQLVNNLTTNLTILTNGETNFSSEQIEKLEKHNIKIINTNISEIEHTNGNLKNILFVDGKKETFDAIYAAIPFEQNSNIPEQLGCQLNEQGYIQVDDFYKTTIEGIYACGDNTNRLRSVSNAVNSGNITGAMLNMELVSESFNN